MEILIFPAEDSPVKAVELMPLVVMPLAPIPANSIKFETLMSILPAFPPAIGTTSLGGG